MFCMLFYICVECLHSCEKNIEVFHVILWLAFVFYRPQSFKNWLSYDLSFLIRVSYCTLFQLIHHDLTFWPSKFPKKFLFILNIFLFLSIIGLRLFTLLLNLLGLPYHSLFENSCCEEWIEVVPINPILVSIYDLPNIFDCRTLILNYLEINKHLRYQLELKFDHFSACIYLEPLLFYNCQHFSDWYIWIGNRIELSFLCGSVFLEVCNTSL